MCYILVGVNARLHIVSTQLSSLNALEQDSLIYEDTHFDNSDMRISCLLM